MIPDDFDLLPINEKLFLLYDEEIDRKGRSKITLKQKTRTEKWFRSGNQWVGPRGVIVEIIGAEPHEQDLSFMKTNTTPVI